MGESQDKEAIRWEERKRPRGSGLYASLQLARCGGRERQLETDQMGACACASASTSTSVRGCTRSARSWVVARLGGVASGVLLVLVLGSRSL